MSPSAAWRFHAAFCPSAVQPGAQCFSTKTHNDPPAKWQKNTLKHVEKWKNQKNKSSTSFKISSSIFCGTPFYTIFLLAPRAPAAPAQGCCCWMESRLSALKPPAPPRACCFCFWGSGPAQLVVAVKRCWECGTHCLKNIIYIYTINNV